MIKKKVRDLMIALGEYATISSEATIQDALIALSNAQVGLTENRHRHRAILVLNDQKQVVGKLSHWAILRSLEPKWLNDDDVESLTRSGLGQEFIDSLRQKYALIPASLERLCLEAAHVKVKEAMVPTQEKIDENSLLMEAIHELVLSRAQSILVTRGEKVIGILRLADVFEEIACTIRNSSLKN
ncbi:CBS domain-containing protein [candidate division CSSED10-310 bacterium]|uniref:CBS domain-containing protein n=1 Tax=candidate division CSSED10-310 bacterium TaxID=2855610 RepID=A0ABV6YTC3_UNCC1